MRAQAERETQQRKQQEREQQLRAQAERESKERATQAAQASLTRAQAEWIDKIRAKIRSNVILPPDIVGNPEARFDVVLMCGSPSRAACARTMTRFNVRS